MKDKTTRITAAFAAVMATAALAVSAVLLLHTGQASPVRPVSLDRAVAVTQPATTPLTYVYTVMFSTPSGDNNPIKTAEGLEAAMQRTLRNLGYAHVAIDGSSLLTTP
jgi:hypothetical protein